MKPAPEPKESDRRVTITTGYDMTVEVLHYVVGYDYYCRMTGTVAWLLLSQLLLSHSCDRSVDAPFK